MIELRINLGAMNNGLEYVKNLSHLLDGLVLLAVLGLVDKCLFEMDDEL